MGRPSSEHPTELELQILRILWDSSPLTVRAVRDRLASAGRDIAHTSVITTLGTMVDKEQLQKLPPQQGKAFLFEPLLQKQDVSTRMLGDIVQRVFDGSASSVMLSLFDCADIDEDELKALRRIFNRKAKERKQ